VSASDYGRPVHPTRRQGEPILVEPLTPRARDMAASGHQALGAAVLRQAHMDISRKLAKRPTSWTLRARIDAILFLTTPSADLEFWCTVAGANVQVVIRATTDAHSERLGELEAALGRVLVEERRKHSEAARRAAAGLQAKRPVGRPRLEMAL